MRCFPPRGPTWIALAFLVGCVLFNNVMQIYSDSLPEYPAECRPLIDMGFKVFGAALGNWGTETAFNNVTDVLVMVSLVILWVIMFFWPQLIFRRWCWIVGITFLTRGLIVGATRYARALHEAQPYVPENWFVGALLILSGRHITASDFMFSGHTANWIIASLFISRYTHWGPFSWIFYWPLSITGILLLSAVHAHYLADIIVAVVISSLYFWTYHLLFDVHCLQQMRPGLDGLIASRPLDIALPATIIDAKGRHYSIGGETPDIMADPDRKVNNTITTLPLPYRDNAWRYRFEVWCYLKWLDAGV